MCFEFYRNLEGRTPRFIAPRRLRLGFICAPKIGRNISDLYEFPRQFWRSKRRLKSEKFPLYRERVYFTAILAAHTIGKPFRFIDILVYFTEIVEAAKIGETFPAYLDRAYFAKDTDGSRREEHITLIPRRYTKRLIRESNPCNIHT